MDVFSQKKLFGALHDAGHDVSPRTVRRWVEGDAPPDTAWQQAVLDVLGIQKGTPQLDAEGLVTLFLKRWATADRPKWAKQLTADVIAAVKDLRGEALEEAARQEVRAAAAELERQIRAARVPGGGGSQRNTPVARAKRSR